MGDVGVGLTGAETRRELRATIAPEPAERQLLLAQLPNASGYCGRMQAGAELDLLLFLKGRRIGIEIKRADAPKRSLRSPPGAQ